MDAQRALTAVGAGVTTFLVVAVVVVELVAVEFSALVGLPVGALAGLAVLAAVSTATGLSARAWRLLSAYAALGLAVLGLAAVQYVSHGGPIDALSTTEVVVVGAAAAALVYAALWLRERGAQRPV